MDITELTNYCKKVGYKTLILQLFRGRCIFFTFIEILLLGFSKKALEILRLAVHYKLQEKLRKKYKYILNQCDNINYNNLECIHSNKIWICWLQGIENAPLLIKRCYKSVCKYLTDKEIILITSENFSEYVTFPKYILLKWKKGKITNTHFTDLLRLELLINYGGIWIDATVLCTGKIPKYIENADLFLFQALKPGRDGLSLPFSSWLISSTTNQKLLIITRYLLYEYWKKNNSMIDYFLLHHFFNIGCGKYPQEYVKIPKFCNSNPHILQFEIFNKFNKYRYNDIKSLSSIHKLSYKYNKLDTEKLDTYYDYIINKGII